MEQSLKVKISVDGDTGKLKIFKTDINQTARNTDEASASIRQLSDSIKTMGHIYIGAALAIKGFIDPVLRIAKAGIQYNAALEQTQLGMKAMIAGYVEGATVAQRLAVANTLAASQMSALRNVAKSTGASFSEVTTAFKTFMPSALSVGMSIGQATKSAQALIGAAKLMGVESGTMIAGIDGVAKGTVLANSDFGRFLSALGLTNEALKAAAESGTTYALIIEKLGTISAAAGEAQKTLNGQISKISSEWDELIGRATDSDLVYRFTSGTAKLLEVTNNATRSYKELVSTMGLMETGNSILEIGEKIQKLQAKIDSSSGRAKQGLIAKKKEYTEQFKLLQYRQLAISEIAEAEKNQEDAAEKAAAAAEVEQKKAARAKADKNYTKLYDSLNKQSGDPYIQLASWVENAAAQADAIENITKDQLQAIYDLISDQYVTKLVEIRRTENQKIVDEAIRSNAALNKINEIGLENAVLRGEITQEEANRKKQILGYGTEIFNIEKQISLLDGNADAARIAELEKTRDLLADQKTLKEAEIIPTDFQKSLANNFADAITQGLIKGIENGKLDARGIVGDIFEGVGASFTAEFTKTLSTQMSNVMAGGSFNGAAMMGGLASMGAGLALNAVAGAITAKWEVTETRDILQEISDNTRETAEAFAAYFMFARRYGLAAQIGVSGVSGVSYGTPDTGTTYKNYGFKQTAPIVGIGTAIIDDMLGGVISSIIGALGIGSSHKTVLKNYNSALQSLEITVSNTTAAYSDAIEAEVRSWMARYQDDKTLYNVLVGVEKSSKKTLLGTKKKTTYIYAQMTMAQAQMAAFLKQFGGDNYGNLNAEGVKKFGEAMNAVFGVLDSLERFAAQASGADMAQYDMDKARAQMQDSAAYIGARYGDLMAELGYDIQSATAAQIAAIMNDQILQEMIGIGGAAMNVEELTSAFNQLYTTLENNRQAVIAYANAQMSRLQSEAEFIDWLQSVPKTASNSLKSFLSGVKSLAAGLRSEAASMHNGDSEYYQRLFLSQQAHLNTLFNDDGSLKNGVTQDELNDIVGAYREAENGLTSALPEYGSEATRAAVEAALNSTADMLDLTHEILSVHIVADDTARNSLGDMLAEINGANLSLDQIGFSGTSEAVKQALAVASGTKTQDELNRLIEAIATLRYGDDASDLSYLDNLAQLAEYDTNALRLAELLQQMIKEMADGNAINTESLKKLSSIEKYEARAELVSQAGGAA